MLLRYRGREGMVAWAFHRISGVAIWLFVVLHVIDISLVGGDPKAYDQILKVYASLPGRIGEALLGAALLYHALNGLRIIVMDFWPPLTGGRTIVMHFWPPLTRFHRQLWYANWAIFAGLGVAVSYFIFRPLFVH